MKSSVGSVPGRTSPVVEGGAGGLASGSGSTTTSSVSAVRAPTATSGHRSDRFRWENAAVVGKKINADEFVVTALTVLEPAARGRVLEVKPREVALRVPVAEGEEVGNTLEPRLFQHGAVFVIVVDVLVAAVIAGNQFSPRQFPREPRL